MRVFITVFAIVLAVIFIGGGINVGSQPLFGHLDTILGTSLFMQVHYSVFWLLYRGEQNVDQGLGRTKKDLDEFNETPLGIDNKSKYRDLDAASKY